MGGRHGAREFDVRIDNSCEGGQFRKIADQIFAPVSGKIIKVNTALDTQPELLNEDPYGEGWVAVIEMTDPKEAEDLMSQEEYEAHVAKEAGE